jgi:putative pyrroloquinoline-quinone binding quinoprotein
MKFPFRLVPATALALALVVAAAAQEAAPIRIQPVKRPVLKGTTAPVGSEPASDAETLKKAHLSETDGGKLIEYLHQRTLTETEQGRIAEIIKRFGVDDFEERLRATREIEAYGPAAIGPLRAAERDSDAEVAYRARQALKRVETVPHAAVAAAAVRAVVKLKPEGAAGALIGFLPLADDESVADLIREALVTLAVGPDGKADPALVAALADASPIRRAAAYVALIHGGNASERIRIKDAYPTVRAAVLKETDAETRFVGLWTLAQTTREKEYIPELIALIPKLPRGRIWQLEDLLLQLAGSHPKDGRFLKSAESLENAARAWQAWWKEKGSTIDFAQFPYKQRVLGFTDLLELDVYANPGRFVSLGHDLKERWKIAGINSLIDARIAPGGHIFVVETNYQRVTERDRSGKVLRTVSVGGQPHSINLLPEGGLLVVCRNGVFELDKEGTQKKHYTRQPNDILAGERLPSGEVFLVTNNGQPKATGITLDANLKETERKVMLGPTFNIQRMDVVGEDRVLVCESSGVAEYEIKTGRQAWRFACNNPNSCQRLLDGNTLICEMNFRPNGRVIEVDPSGEVVWEYRGKGPLRIGRAYRR